MSYKVRNTPAAEIVTCEKYVNRMMQNEKKLSNKKSPTRSEKYSNVIRSPASVNNQRQKSKSRQSSTLKTPLPSNRQKDAGDNLSTGNRRTRSATRCRSVSSDRESWGKVLHKNLSNEKASSFGMFDPLRTVHFLSRELYNQLQTLLPDDDNVIQMISDIQHALKRIPSEVTTVLPTQEYEKFSVVKPASKNKCIQTPPTLYQEDTEKFQKIMEENTYRLEASCQQLENVCLNLQKEKETTERELEEARENIKVLTKKVKELEHERREGPHSKLIELENEKEKLQMELNRALQDKKNVANINILKKHIEDLQKQKSTAEENCTRLEYDLTMLKMDKEKFITMLSVRDREIKEIQEEMSRIQEQVHQQLKKLNVDVTPALNNLKQLSEPCSSAKEGRNFVEIGDSTISSINSNDSEKEQGTVYKEVPCGDAVAQDLHHTLMEKLSKIKSINSDLLGERKECSSFDDILKELSPSCRALLSSNN